jgi:hypothetical protein
MADKLKGGIIGGATDLSIPVLLRKQADNTELKGLLDASLLCSYWRQGGIRVSIATTSLAAANSAHADGGWVEVNSLALPGLYRLDLPDAAVASAADWVVVAVLPSSTTTGYLWAQEYTITGDPASSLGFATINVATESLIAAVATISTGFTTYDALVPADLAVAVSSIAAYVMSLYAHNDLLAASTALTAYDALIPADLAVAVSSLAVYITSLRSHEDLLAASTALTAYDALIPADLAIAVTSIAAYVMSLYAHNDLLAASTALTAYQVASAPLQYSIAMAGLITSIVDGVYDELYSGHRIAGSFGLYMSKGVPKNTAWSDFTFGMVDSTDHRTPKTGLTISAYVSKDAAAFAAIAGTVAEISNGIYQLDAAAGDMNGDMVIFRFTATGADDTFTTVKTC